MTMFAARFAQAAERLVGSPYRLHGRDPRTGIDCVGLVLEAMRAGGRKPIDLPAYGLRNRTISPFLVFADRNGFSPSSGGEERGDLLLFATGPAQHHLAIALNAGAIAHAHAGLRKTIRQIPPETWTRIARWRPREME
ncbi:peptidoglycan endopeptidase [Erythrobacter litoralis]|uniref:NlpC/P60 family protein n=1 Tax=Erythrobacter litoralis TaxID=39960 RepID=UPI002434AD13|nr:NlpC/P60 family protein [Erythrobacter litoralis]MDG6079190.1 peptidoglycan endopeptidase [Erythrobacter litoralis]